MEEHEHILLKLVTSEVIVGRLDSLSDDIVVLEYPMLINFVESPITGDTRIFLSAYNPFYSESNILYLKRKHILFDSPIDADYSAFYERHVARYTQKISTKDEDDEVTQYLQALQISSNTTIN
jgi:hypothetical protein